MKEEEFNSSDEDEEVRKACLLNGVENCPKNENDDKNYSIQNYLQSITNVAKKSSSLRSKLRDELKQIKVNIHQFIGINSNLFLVLNE